MKRSTAAIQEEENVCSDGPFDGPSSSSLVPPSMSPGCELSNSDPDDVHNLP